MRVQAMATEGVKAKTALHEMAEDGAFKRTDAGFRSQVSASDEHFKPEAGRYHLYVSYACPWACRALAVLYLKGLEDAIGVSITHPTWQETKPGKDDHTGWVFVSPSDPPLSSSTGQGSFPCDDAIPDTVNNKKTVRELYELAQDKTGKYTVPVLWDKKLKTIVNNESSEIIRMLNSAFNDIAKVPELDLYPEALRSTIDSINEWVYPTINNGVYRCGFATKQAAYETAFNELFESLDRVEALLSKHRYIAGDVLTEADVRLFMTLIRFDEVYVVYFKTNKAFLHEYENIRGYVQDLYSHHGFAKSVNIRHIKTHYFTSHPKLNFYAIIPKGGEAWWEQPSPRAAQFGSKQDAS